MSQQVSSIWALTGDGRESRIAGCPVQPDMLAKKDYRVSLPGPAAIIRAGGREER